MARAPSLFELPFWPRCLSRAEAARYVGVGVDVFDAEVRAGMWPPGRRRGAKGGRLTWDRAVLDAALDRQAALQTSALDDPDPQADPIPLQERISAAFGNTRSQRRPQKAA